VKITKNDFNMKLKSYIKMSKEIFNKIVSSIIFDFESRFDNYYDIKLFDKDVSYSFGQFNGIKIKNNYNIELVKICIVKPEDYKMGICIHCDGSKNIISVESSNIPGLFKCFLEVFEKLKMCVMCKTINILRDDICTGCYIISHFNGDTKYPCCICQDETWNYATTPCCKNKFHACCLLSIDKTQDNGDVYIKCPICRGKIYDDKLIYL
jgi:hypothetical protein